MHYGGLKTCDTANGPGVRTTLFVSGCRHHCEGCFQPETWDFAYGQPFGKESEQEIIASLEPDYIRGLTLLGGEPFEPENQRALVPFLEEVRARFPGKDIWCFTGYRLEELAGWPENGEAGWSDGDDRWDTGESEHARECAKKNPPRCEQTDRMLALIDILVDGEFELEKKNLSLQFRGSTNQRIIRLAESLAAGAILLWKDDRSLEKQMAGQTGGLSS